MLHLRTSRLLIQLYGFGVVDVTNPIFLMPLVYPYDLRTVCIKFRDLVVKLRLL